MATREFETWQESWVLATEARKNMDRAYEELENALQDEQKNGKQIVTRFRANTIRILPLLWVPVVLYAIILLKISLDNSR